MSIVSTQRCNIFPEHVLLIIYEYAESIQRNIVLADIQQLNFVIAFLGYRHILPASYEVRLLREIQRGEVMRRWPVCRHRNYGQHKFIEGPISCRQEKRKKKHCQKFKDCFD